MSKRATPIALAATMLLMSGGAQAAIVDIAVNGGFETGDFTGWAQPTGAAYQSIISPGASGNFAASFNVPSVPAASVLKQERLLDGTGQLGPGSVINFSFDYRGSAGAGGVFFVKSICETATGTCGDLLEGPLSFNQPDWTTYMGSFTLGAGATAYTLEFAPACGAAAGCFANYDIDNVVILADIAPIPVPAAVWLFGSAIGLLGWMRRKVS